MVIKFEMVMENGDIVTGVREQPTIEDFMDSLRLHRAFIMPDATCYLPIARLTVWIDEKRHE